MNCSAALVTRMKSTPWNGSPVNDPCKRSRRSSAIGSYGRILTVLTCPDLLDEGFMEEDEDSDEVLEESWTPRFRR